MNMRIVELTVTKKGEFGERAKKAEPWEFGIAFLSSDRVKRRGRGRGRGRGGFH